MRAGIKMPKKHLPHISIAVINDITYVIFPQETVKKVLYFDFSSTLYFAIRKADCSKPTLFDDTNS